ncbi:hypothetical protein ACE6H2_008715 [Prunus campanulata]
MEVLSELNIGPSIQFITVFVVTLTAIFAGYYFKFKASFSLIGKKLPPGSFGLPLIGESISFIRAQKQDKTDEWIQTRIRKYGPVFKTSLMGDKTVVLTGQAGNRFVFSGSDNGIAGNQVETASKILGKHSIFELSESRHKLVRSGLMSFLKPESIQRFVGEMDSLVQQQLFKELNGKDLVQMVGLMKKITFKVTCSLLFGLPEGQEKDALLEDFAIATKGLWAIPLNIPGTIFYKAMQARGRISKILINLMQNRRVEEDKNTSQKNDIISVFLHLRDEAGEPLQVEEILDNLITLVVASHDTTTILLGLILRHLSTDAKTFGEVLEEQKEVAKAVKASGDEGRLTWSEIQMMKHTWRVAQELMRLTPPVFGNFKCASRDTSFDGFHIPKGWKVDLLCLRGFVKPKTALLMCQFSLALLVMLYIKRTSGQSQRPNSMHFPRVPTCHVLTQSPNGTNLPLHYFIFPHDPQLKCARHNADRN